MNEQPRKTVWEETREIFARWNQPPGKEYSTAWEDFTMAAKALLVLVGVPASVGLLAYGVYVLFASI